MVCPTTLQCLYTQTIQLPVSSTSACNNPSLEISEKPRLTVDVIVRTIITRVRNRVLYRITHDCDRILSGYCTRKQSATLAGLFVTDSLVTPVGYTSCQLDLAVSLAASIADWRDQTVTNKPARECLWHSVGVQYPGRMHRQPCVILYI